jgi:hypothetical protein
LIAFTAEGLENNTAKLIWSTASEFNNVLIRNFTTKIL